MANMETFFAWLDSPDDHQRGMAVAAYWHCGEIIPAWEEKIRTLITSDSCVAVRRDAVCILADRALIEDADLLIDRLDDEDWRVRGHAVRGLRAINASLLDDDRIKPHLDQETHPFVRHCAGIM